MKSIREIIDGTELKSVFRIDSSRQYKWFIAKLIKEDLLHSGSFLALNSGSKYTFYKSLHGYVKIVVLNDIIKSKIEGSFPKEQVIHMMNSEGVMEDTTIRLNTNIDRVTIFNNFERDHFESIEHDTGLVFSNSLITTLYDK